MQHTSSKMSGLGSKVQLTPKGMKKENSIEAAVRCHFRLSSGSVGASTACFRGLDDLK